MLTRTALFVLCATITAHAQDAGTPLPVVDVEAECHAQFPAESSIRAYNDCIDKNQDGFQSLKYIWDDTPEQVRRQSISWTNSNPKLRPWYYHILFRYVVDLRRMYDYQHPTTHHFDKTP